MSNETVVIKNNKTSNDPIADFLTRVRNAIIAKKATVQVPFSKLKLELANLLRDEGYIASLQTVNAENVATKSIEITLKYSNGDSVIKGLKKISKPGLRKYTKAKYSPRVLSGLGVSILTTSQGLRTDRKARKDKVGGEILCQVW